MSYKPIVGSTYEIDDSYLTPVDHLVQRVNAFRSRGNLPNEVLHRIRRYFRIKNIYHSNAIEGNTLDIEETRQVVDQGLTITGKPLEDQAEARNLSHAFDFVEHLVTDNSRPITEGNIRELHSLVLEGIHHEAGAYRTIPVSISGSNHSPPSPEAVPAQMHELGEWLANQSVPTSNEFARLSGLLAAIAAHTWLVTVHPFADGNGRVARLLMNLMLTRYGFPIAIVAKEDRLRYYDALEISHSSDLTPFMFLIAECTEESIEEYETATKEHQEA